TRRRSSMVLRIWAGTQKVMKKILVILAFGLWGYTASAQTTFQAVLRGSYEVPSNGSSASGFGTVVLSADQSLITVNLSFSGLSTNATAAHIHGPGGAGTNASVLFPFGGVPAATGGAIPQQVFAVSATVVGYLQSGLLYINVHDANFPGGEIRGQL